MNKKILLGTIGYHNLSNHSIGPLLLDKIKQLDWAHHIEIEEMNWGPIAIVQWFQSLVVPYDRFVLFTAIQRANRAIGDFTLYQWVGGLPSEKAIQARIGDAVTGVISPENLLIIGEYFKIWPQEVYILDVEPGPEVAGTNLTTEVGERVMEYLDVLKDVSLYGSKNEKKIVLLQGDKIHTR